MTYVKVVALSNLWSGEKLGLNVHGKKVLIVNIEGAVFAYEDRCPHLGLPLSEGELIGARLVCRGHCWEYDVCTGAGINPSTVYLSRLPVILDDDDVLVEIDG